MVKNSLGPVSRTTLTTDVCRRLVEQLSQGYWKEGDRIPPERELGRLLGVGRASLREALKALEIMGMIEIRRGDGTFVCNRSEFFSSPMLWSIVSSSTARVQELVEARRAMESELAALAAVRADESDLTRIANSLAVQQKTTDSPDQFLEADLEFHMAIADAAHNGILLNTVQLIRNLMRQWIESTDRIPGIPAKALAQHKTIFKAISKKDPEAARSAMENHLTSMGEVLLVSRGPKAKVSSSRRHG